MSGRCKGEKTKGETKTTSTRADLQFPIDRIHRLLKTNNYTERVGADAPIYLAAVMECLAADVLDVVDAAREKSRIIPRHLPIGHQKRRRVEQIVVRCSHRPS